MDTSALIVAIVLAIAVPLGLPTALRYIARHCVAIARRLEPAEASRRRRKP